MELLGRAGLANPDLAIGGEGNDLYAVVSEIQI